ncbi:SAV_2336 N-terminal domain-related protein [Nonomuraea rubra]
MIDQLLRAIIDSGADAGPEELTDILWLATRISTASVAPSAVDDRFVPQSEPDAQEPAETMSRSGDPLYPASSPADPATFTERPGVRVRVRRASSLRDPLAVMRAFRPLGRRTTIGSRRIELDEEGTIATSVEQRLLLPVLRPAKDRWLNLTLVVDAHSSMLLWHDLVRELHRTISQTGLFRTVRTCYLYSPDHDRPASITLTPGGDQRSPQEIVDPAGHHLILLLTDTVADGWHHLGLHQVLHRWCTHSTVAVLNVLPERLWNRGAVQPVPLMLRVPGPATPNNSWNVAAPRARRRGRSLSRAAVPIVDASPEALSTLARLVAGDGRWHRMLCVRLDPTPSRTPSVTNASAPSGAEVLRRFQERASPTAQELAGYLSAVPLNLPVMTLVRQVMVPHADHGHLAEVALGGLFEPWEITPGTDPDRMALEFLPGVRESLLGSQLRQDITATQEVVRRELTAYLSQQPGTAGDFPATRLTPTGAGTQPVPVGASAFARVENPSVTDDHGAYGIQDLQTSEPIPPSANLSRLLSPRHGVVPFFGRTQELHDLANWRDETEHFSVRLLHGLGGQGKTRLALEFAAESRRAGWAALQANPIGTPLPSGDGPWTSAARILLIVDEAESWPSASLLGLIEEWAFRHENSVIRVLLLAREAGAWWHQLIALIAQSPPAQAQLLGPLAETAVERFEIFQAACDGYARTLGLAPDATVIHPPRSLERDAADGRVLDIHMAALAAVQAHLHATEDQPSNSPPPQEQQDDELPERGFTPIGSDTGVTYSDEPVLSDELNRSEYARHLAELARRATPPLVVGVFGEWGTGKTSLLMQIRDLLIWAAPECAQVWFDPWLHQHEEDPVLPLLHVIVNDLGLQGRRSIRRTLSAISEVLGSPASARSLRIGLPRLLRPSRIDDTERFRLRSERTRLNEHLAKLIDEVLASCGKERLIVFVDDLDRCDGGRITSLLEALSLHFNRDNCVFVLSAEKGPLLAAVREKYQDPAEYLDKIIQFPFEIPGLAETDFERYLRSLLRGHDEVSGAEDVLRCGLRRNPRAIKRFVNILRLLDRVAKDRQMHPYDLSILAAVLLLRDGAPDDYERIIRDPLLLRAVGANPDEFSELTVRVVDQLRASPGVPDDVMGYVDLVQTSPVPQPSNLTSARSRDPL